MNKWRNNVHDEEDGAIKKDLSTTDFIGKFSAIAS